MFLALLYLILALAPLASSRLPQQKQESQHPADRGAVMPPGLQRAACSDDTPSAASAHTRPGRTEEEEIIMLEKVSVHFTDDISEVKLEYH